MPRIIKPLSALAVEKLKTVGWHAVGGVSGLALQIRKSQGDSTTLARSWVLRTHIADQRVPLGLGSYPQISLTEAREKAKVLAGEVSQGLDPRLQRKKRKSDLLASQAKSKTFKDCAEAYIDAKESGFTNDKHKKQWATTLRTYAYPIIGNMLVSEISMRNVLDVLQQTIKDQKTKKVLGKFWELKTETASRVQGRIKSVFDYSIVSGYRTTLNPATWDGYLETQLVAPAKLKPVKHHPSLPYSELGQFMANLRKNESISAKALEFLIYSGFRSGSVRLAKWEDIDFDKKVWNIPAPDTKTKVEHTVPLTPQAIKFLKIIRNSQTNTGTPTPYIFPGLNGKPLSDMALSELMRGMKTRGEITSEAVPHGFRATFRTWLAEQTSYPDEIRKAANGHKVSDAVKASYERTDFFEKRRKLMNDWSKFLDRPSLTKLKQPRHLKKHA